MLRFSQEICLSLVSVAAVEVQGSASLRQIINLRRQCKVDICYAAAVVGGEGEFGVAPAESYVGMVVGGFGKRTDAVDEFETLGKVLKRSTLFQITRFGYVKAPYLTYDIDKRRSK